MTLITTKSWHFTILLRQTFMILYKFFELIHACSHLSDAKYYVLRSFMSFCWEYLCIKNWLTLKPPRNNPKPQQMWKKCLSNDSHLSNKTLLRNYTSGKYFFQHKSTRNYKTEKFTLRVFFILWNKIYVTGVN